MTQPLLDRVSSLLHQVEDLENSLRGLHTDLVNASQTSPAAPSGPPAVTELSAHTVLKLNRRTAALLQPLPTRQGPVAEWIEPDAHGMAARDGAWGK